MKRKPLENLIFSLLIGATLVVAINAWLAFRAEQVMAESEYWVAHTWEVIAGLDHALGLVKDAESGARGYLITGDTRYLAARDTADHELPGELAHLEWLVRDNPPQIERVQRLADAAKRRMERIAYTVGVRRTQGQQAAFALVLQGIGIADMNQLRGLVTDMQAEERGLLAKRVGISARARTQARVTVAVASALDLVFIVGSLWSLGYERKLRLLASETARRLEKLQAISDVGLTQLSLDELTREMLERLRRVAEIDGVALLAWEAESLQATAAMGVRLEPGSAVPAAAESPLVESSQGNTVVRLEGAELNRLGIPAFEERMRSVLILPLAVEGRVTALMIAGRLEENSFARQDEEVLSVVADRIARAIDRARLFDAEHYARREAEAAASEVQLLNAELEERVRLRTAELEATSRELEAFSYSVSHDLRAPLRSVDGFSYALEEDYGELLSAEGKHYLGRIRAGVQRMGQLIDALLQLSRITRAEITVEPVDLSAMALEVARELEQQNVDRRIDFFVQPDLHTLGDARLLRVIFENMLGNAVKFTANVSAARIHFGYSDERAAYYIRDNGAGFDQQYAKKLFIAFQRLHGEKDFKGSGIGLATVARVIRRHQGQMSAEGVVNQGATFWFTLNATT
jgi:signal transduction histidine kinase/CHASE3 domain sensor protein